MPNGHEHERLHNDLEIDLKVSGNFEVHHHHHGNVAGHEEMLGLLRAIKAQLGEVMATIEEANAAIAKIDATTTKMAEAQLANGNVLQEVSDDIDDVIKKLNEAGLNVPPELLTRLQASADAAQAVSDANDAQAAILKGIGAKWPAGPVVPPEPIPPPVVFERRRR